MSREQKAAFVKIIQEYYSLLRPAHWIARFENGRKASSNQYPSFLDLPEEKRKQIAVLKFRIGSNTYAIDRRVNGTLAPGFFYHILKGSLTVMGKYRTNIPYIEERIGFCYNSKGDARCILVEHSEYRKAVTQRIRFLENLVAQHYSPAQINRFVKMTLPYQIRSHYFSENIVERRVNINRFGTLEELPEVGVPPRLLDNNQEVVIP